MWWAEVKGIAETIGAHPNLPRGIDASASIAADAVLDHTKGPIAIGARTRVCSGAIVRGPVVIGANCLIGDRAVIRGPALIGNGVRVGYATEIKTSIVRDNCTIGPLSASSGTPYSSRRFTSERWCEPPTIGSIVAPSRPSTAALCWKQGW